MDLHSLTQKRYHMHVLYTGVYIFITFTTSAFQLVPAATSGLGADNQMNANFLSSVISHVPNADNLSEGFPFIEDGTADQQLKTDEFEIDMSRKFHTRLEYPHTVRTVDCKLEEDFARVSEQWLRNRSLGRKLLNGHYSQGMRTMLSDPGTNPPPDDDDSPSGLV